jgi:hypothetical protein
MQGLDYGLRVAGKGLGMFRRTGIAGTRVEGERRQVDGRDGGKGRPITRAHAIALGVAFVGAALPLAGCASNSSGDSDQEFANLIDMLGSSGSDKAVSSSNKDAQIVAAAKRGATSSSADGTTKAIAARTGSASKSSSRSDAPTAASSARSAASEAGSAASSIADAKAGTPQDGASSADESADGTFAASSAGEGTTSSTRADSSRD